MIRESVRLAFDPKTENREIQDVFSNDLARTLWLAVKQGHLINNDFNKSCLRYARIIKKTAESRELNAEVLFRIISGFACSPGDGIIGPSERDFAIELLPFITGEKSISFESRVQ